MKKLNIRLTKGGKEYRAAIAVCTGTPTEEFLCLLRASLPIPDAEVIGFKDSQGVLLIPSLICSDPGLIRSDDYELILRERTSRPEEQFSHIISEIRVKNCLNDEEYFALRSWIRENNQMTAQVYQAYFVKHDIEGFMEWLLKSSIIRHSSSRVIERSHLHDSIRRTEERPATSRVGDRPRTSNQDKRSYQNYIQIMGEMETQGLLEQIDVRIIKALILRENFGVMREFDHYFLHSISLRELGNRLQKLADKLSLYMERPSSPIQKNNQLEFLVDSFARDNLINLDDIEVLKKLILDENEFVFSAFDVYESDRDQGELIDSLMRAIRKYAKPLSESIRSSSFYPNPPPVEVAPTFINQEVILKVIRELNLSKNWSDEINGTLKALVESGSSAVCSAFENYLRHQEQEYLETHLFAICNSYFHLLLCTAFGFENTKEIKNGMGETESPIKDCVARFGDDGNCTKMLEGLSGILMVKLSDDVNCWEEVIKMLEDFDYSEYNEIEI